MTNTLIIDHGFKVIKVLQSCENEDQHIVAHKMFKNFIKTYRKIIDTESV